MGRRLTTKEFIEKAKKKHGDKYDYSKVVYKSSREKVTIICPEQVTRKSHKDNGLNTSK